MSKPYTVLLLRPDYVAETFGHDTFCTHVMGETPASALIAARKEACSADESDNPEDYHCLFCVDGHVLGYQDGMGGVFGLDMGIGRDEAGVPFPISVAGC